MFDKDIKLTSTDGSTVLEVVGGTEGEKSIVLTYNGVVVADQNQPIIDLLALACHAQEANAASSAAPAPGNT